MEGLIGDFPESYRAARGAEAAAGINVHTKLAPDLSWLDDLGTADVKAIVERSPRRLLLEQLHLVQFFWLDLSRGAPLRALEALLRLREAGKIRHLRLTNWDAPQIAPFVEAGFEIVSAQVLYSLLDRRPEATLVPWAARNDMHLLCYGTLAGGGSPSAGSAWRTPASFSRTARS